MPVLIGSVMVLALWGRALPSIGIAQATLTSTPKSQGTTSPPALQVVPTVPNRLPTTSWHSSSQAEAQLVQVYQLIAQGDTRRALQHAQALVREFPNFALGQLAYADLLTARTQGLDAVGAGAGTSPAAQEELQTLLDEARTRLRAISESPQIPRIPQAFVRLAPKFKHAIAIDVSRNRLYLFENRDGGLVRVADYYASIGKMGADKQQEGDQRTPLGLYFITSQLDPESLQPFYGSGALPINYPNVLDQRRGKTGSGIWLHGTPPEQFSRPPRASDGCIVLANPDLDHVLRTVAVNTPVLIAQDLQWTTPQATEPLRAQFESRLNAWLHAKSTGQWEQFSTFYAPDFNKDGLGLSDVLPRLQRDFNRVKGRGITLKDLSLMYWKDQEDIWVVTFGEVLDGQSRGIVRRQYWGQRGDRWQIFYEGVIG
ncbi:MAG: hypothetical protein OHK0048_12090 [Rhodoferax sp.]